VTQEKKHADEVRSLTERVAIEKQSWEENQLKRQSNWAAQTEREIREKLKRERDREIELLIGKLEAEATASREECERTADNRIKRIRDKVRVCVGVCVPHFLCSVSVRRFFWLEFSFV
jgi:5-azacytidine-induced protein 1